MIYGLIHQSLYGTKVSTLSGRQVRVNCIYLIQANIESNLVAISKFAVHKESRKRVVCSTLVLNIQPSEVSVSFDRDRSSLFVPPSTQDHIKGMLNAIIVLVMYGDYKCSQSANVYRLIKVIERQLSVSLGENYLCFIFRHFPQIEIHSHAQRAAEAAQAAAVQGQFWQMYEMLFTDQQKLGNGYLVEYANNLGLDTADCRFMKYNNSNS